MSGNGPLGSDSNPGFREDGLTSLAQHRPPGPLCGTRPSRAEVAHHATRVAHGLSSAMSWADTHRAVWALLGGDCFSAGVAAGMVKNVAISAYQLVKLYKMFAMAEYYESRHSHGFWDNVSSGMMFAKGIGSVGMMAASYFWPDFDKEAKQAFDERAVLFRTVAYAFEHPGEIFKSITAEQKGRYEEFVKYLGRRTLAGNYHAGVLFGGLLLDVLLILDGVTAIEQVATKVPGLLEMLPRLKELAPVLRNTRNGGAVEDAAKAVKRKDITVYDSLNPDLCCQS